MQMEPPEERLPRTPASTKLLTPKSMQRNRIPKQTQLLSKVLQKHLPNEKFCAQPSYGHISGLAYSCASPKTSPTSPNLKQNPPSLAITQYIGAPLYLIKKDYYYRYMAFTKEGMAVLILSMTQWWTSTEVHISGDDSVKDQIRLLPNGRLECNFSDRLVLIANHQVLSIRYSASP